MKKILLVCFLLLTPLFAPYAQEMTKPKPFIVTSINPVYQVVLAITEDKDNIALIIDPQVFEHEYQLKKNDIKDLAKADLVFYISDDLEQNFAKMKKEEKFYQLSGIKGIKLLKRRDNLEKNDQHIWLNPDNVIKIAEFITKKLSKIDQNNAEKYKNNFAKFRKNILQTKNEIAKDLEKKRVSGYAIAHDGYQYFENYFNLKSEKTIFYDHNRDLNLGDFKEFDSLVKDQKIKCIFADEFDEKNTAIKLAKNYNLKLIKLNLIGRKDQGYASLLRNVGNGFLDCF